MSNSDFVKDALKLMAVEPGLPISNARSSTLPSEADVVIIGSGITGIGAAHCVLNHPDGTHLKVIMLEARTATSGATGRNGGHLVSDSDSLFPTLVKSVGLERAIETARFSEANICRLRELVSELDPTDREAVEYHTLTTATAFTDQSSFNQAVDEVQQLLKTVPDGELKYKVFNSEDSVRIFNFINVAGVLAQTGVAALSAYRLLTAVLAVLRKEFSDRFSLETNTPALSVNMEKDLSEKNPYVICTPRGSIRAKHVIHCTNGYSGHLIPGLVGSLYPLRGTMSTQKMGPTFPNIGDKMSWSQVSHGTYDAETGHVNLGLYYAQQNAKTGVMFLGGESQKLSTLLTSDDSDVAEDACQSLSSAAAKIWKDAGPAKVLEVWSGIMGFTADGMPLVGNLPPSLTGRAGNCEWIAAGFNGHGMDKCWLSGEAIAKMVLGEQDVAGFPKSYLLSDDRVRSWTSEQSAETFMNHIMLGTAAPASHL
ncbi:hypothetical protein ACHAPO_009569 [Fusarium lateritium]